MKWDSIFFLATFPPIHFLPVYLAKLFIARINLGFNEKINESDNLRATPTQSFPNCLFGIEIETFPLGIPMNLWGKQKQVSSFVNLPPRFKAHKKTN
jgi:hypothetical protein